MTVNGDNAYVTVGEAYASDVIGVRVRHDGSRYILYVYGLKDDVRVDVSGFSTQVVDGWPLVGGGNGWAVGEAMTNGGKITITLKLGSSTKQIVVTATGII